MHVARDNFDPAGEPPVPAAPRLPTAHCTRCQGSLAGLSPVARFCPRCGDRLTGFAAPARVDQPGAAPPEAATPLSAPPAAAEGSFSSDIIRGYASAMYRLGVRYEVRRNAAEAFRCYGKASHLGNAPAAARLLNLGATEPAVPAPDAPPAS